MTKPIVPVVTGAYVDRGGVVRQIPRRGWRRLWVLLTARRVYL